MAGSAEKRVLNIRTLLTDDISPKLDEIVKAVKRTGDETEKQNKKSERSWASLKKAVGAAAVAYGAFKAAAFAKQVIDETDAVGKLATAIGDSTESVSELAFAFTSAGGNAEQFRAVMSSLLSAQKGALNGSKEQVAAFKALGVSVKELRTASPGELFGRLADGYDRIQDATKRSLTFATLFPEQWRNVINLVEGGGDAFEKRLLDARAAGATVTKEQAAAAAEVNDAFLRLETSVKSVQRQLILVFGPTLSAALSKLATTLAANSDSIKQFAVFVLRIIQSMVSLIGDAAVLIASIPQSGVAKTLGTVAEAFTFGYYQGGSDEVRQQREQINKEIDLTVRQLAQKYEAERRSLGYTQRDEERANKRQQTIAALESKLASLRAEYDRLAPAAERVIGVQQRINTAMRQLVETTAKAAASSGSGIAGGGGGTDGPLSGIAELFQQQGDTAGSSFVDSFIVRTQIGLREGIHAVAQFVGEAKDKLDELADPRRAERFAAGWTKATERLRMEMGDAYATLGFQLGQLATQSVDLFSDNLADVITGAKTAEEAFKSFLTSTLGLLAKVAARLATIKLLETVGYAAALAKGGVLPGVSDERLPVRSYAKGGVARSPQVAIYGEGNRNEAFVPLPDNRSIPVTFTGGGSPGGNRTVNVNVYAWDSRDAARGLVENQEVLRSLWQTQAETRQGVRQTLQQAAR